MGLTLNDYQFFHHKQAGYQISDQDEDSGDSDICTTVISTKKDSGIL